MSNATNFVRCNGSRKKGHFFLLFTGGSLGEKISHKITYQCTIMFFQKMWRRFILTPCACSVKFVFHYEMHISKKMVLVAVKFSHMYKTLYCVVIKWSCVDGKTWVRVFVISSVFVVKVQQHTQDLYMLELHCPLQELLGHLTQVQHSSRKSSATHFYQCALYFHMSGQWYGCQCLGFVMCMLMHMIACGCCMDTESPLKVELGRKIPCKHHLTYLVFLLPL